MESKAAGVRAGDLQHSFPLVRKLLSQRRSGGVGPASPHGRVVDDGEGAEQSSSYESRPPDAGAEQCATECFADRIREYQTVVSRRISFRLSRAPDYRDADFTANERRHLLILAMRVYALIRCDRSTIPSNSRKDDFSLSFSTQLKNHLALLRS